MTETFIETPAEPATSWTQVAAAVLLGIAATLTAFSAYEGGLTDGEALQGYTASTRTLSDANAFYAESNQTFALDNQLFVAYVQALHSNNTELADYLKTLMRDELTKAIDWWQNTEPADTPFDDNKDNPYTIKAQDDAQGLEKQAGREFDKGKEADDKGDNYSLATVLFALALFFGGIATLFKRRGVTTAMLLVSAATVVAGCFPLFTTLFGS